MSHIDDRVIFFDTTLRDGEQALRASLGLKEKLLIAKSLERLQVDVMEVGFPVSSPGDFNSVKTIAEQIRDASVCGLARAVQGDIDACGEALKGAARPRIHTFIATSPLHLQYKLKKNLDEVIEMAVGAVRHARRYTDDVEFSCEDAGRTPIDDLCRVVEAAISAGASTINIPDTVGYTTPGEFAAIISALRNRVPNVDKARLSVHCHNDLGLAVANSVAAVAAGARQVECTINGIGERAGNCALEEVAMILQTRQDQFGIKTGLVSKEIHRTSQMVSQICNMPIQPNKAIVGANAFAHSSGIHQDGVLKAQNTYEIISPETIGLAQNELNMTSRSGRHVIKHRLAELGYHDDDYDMDQLYQSFLSLADKKGRVYDYDLEALVFFNGMKQEDDHFALKRLQVTSSTEQPSTAMVQLRVGEELIEEASTGIGPVDAVYRAVDRISGEPLQVIDYNLEAKGQGQNALGQVDIVVEYQGRRFHGAGLATDIVEASARAYVNALNLIRQARQISNWRETQSTPSGI